MIESKNAGSRPDDFAQAMADAGRLPGRTVVATVMANLGFKRAMADESVKLPVGPTEVRYWPEYGAKEKQAAPAAAK